MGPSALLGKLLADDLLFRFPRRQCAHPHNSPQFENFPQDNDTNKIKSKSLESQIRENLKNNSYQDNQQRIKLVYRAHSLKAT